MLFRSQKTKNGDIETFYNNPSFGSPWIKSIDEAEKWLEKRENFRLEQEEIESPDTGWIFIEFTEVSLKVIIDKKPLLGNGKLPDWLRNLYHGGNMNCLDTYEDNLCVWRCIAVHKGQNPKRCTQKARAFASGFFKSNKQEAVNCLEKVEQHLNQKKDFSEWLTFSVYEPEKTEKEIIWHLTKAPMKNVKNIITIGVYKGHAFYIKDITKLAKVYNCVDCNSRFTKTSDLYRHHTTCSKGETKMFFPKFIVKKLKTDYEKAFYPKENESIKAVLWMEEEAKKRGIHIHHSLCGHGGERFIGRKRVDGFNKETNTIFEFYGCFFHGCPWCYPDRRDYILKDGGTLEER